MRVRQIMSDERTAALDGGRRALLAGSALLALGLPVMAGLSATPLAIVVQRHVAAVQARAEEAVTAVAERIGAVPSAPVQVPMLSRRKVTVAEPVMPPPVTTPVTTPMTAPVTTSVAAPDPAPPVAAQATAAPQPSPEPAPSRALFEAR